jgi:hypothetical protein
MDRKTAERSLEGAGLRVTNRTRTKDNFADRLECATGEIVNVYDSGACKGAASHRHFRNGRCFFNNRTFVMLDGAFIPRLQCSRDLS